MTRDLLVSFGLILAVMALWWAVRHVQRDNAHMEQDAAAKRFRRQVGTPAEVAEPQVKIVKESGVTRMLNRVFRSVDYAKYRNPDREARRHAGWPSGRQWVKMRKAARRGER